MACLVAALMLGGAAPLAQTPDQIVASAPAAAWQRVAADDLLVLELAQGRRVVIELAPQFAPVHVGNIRALAKAGWWDGGSIERVQDDYVVQWAGAGTGGALPAGVVAHPPAEYERDSGGLAFRALATADPYARQVGHVDGWPVGRDGGRTWLAHCYGMVGVGRDMPPDTGNGTELYSVIGQAPRQLDRNIALVGRVVEGMSVLTSLPRGTATLGFYATAGEHVPFRRVRLASDLPVAERPHDEVMRTDSDWFARYATARANRGDGFFVRPAGGVDLCNLPVPVRVVP